ncbi:MAG: 2-methylcitrate synthase [Methylacidiphilales bacterium]|nr:2-methylcitrate synthase [Candidatus Methylacidiphilales bacterium]
MSVTSPGLKGIVAASTRLSDVLGEEGILIYAGYDINELAGKVSYEEVVYLLWHDELPNKAQLEKFKADLRAARELPPPVVDFLANAPRDANVMDVLRTGISMLGLYDHAPIGPQPPEILLPRAISLTAKVGIIIAYYHRARQGKSLPPIRTDLDEAAHFLYLINGETPGPEAVKTLDLAYVLHADHGFNASTFSALVTIATLSDIYSAVTTAIGTLKGPLHGGANEAVIHMLEAIGSPDKVDAWVRAKLAKKEKIMGMGHAVYKVLDPRAPHLKAMAVKLSQELGETKWVEMSDRIAAIVKKEKNLNANVDFYSATVYYSLGIPTDLFTPIFAIARMSGWTGHIIEQLKDNKIFRPSSEYVGFPVGKKVVPLDKR